MASRFKYASGLDPATEGRIAEIVGEDRERRGEPARGPAVITRRATPAELARFDQRHRMPPATSPTLPTRRPIATKSNEEAVKDSSPPPAALARPAPAIDELIAEGFGIAESERNRLRAPRPLVSSRPDGYRRLNRYASDALGIFTHLYLLVDMSARRLAVVVGTLDQATAVGSAPRKATCGLTETVMLAREELSELGMLGLRTRQFRPSRVERGLIVVDVVADELVTP